MNNDVTRVTHQRHELAPERQPTRQPDAAAGAVAPRPVAPPRYKLALLTWVGAYALITLILAALGPAMAAWPLALRTLLLSVMMIVALTWLVMPRLTRLFSPWLSPST